VAGIRHLLKETADRIPILKSPIKAIYRKARIGLLESRWDEGLFLPILIRLDRSWQEYYDGLSKPARKNYKAAMGKNSDVVFGSIDPDKETITRFVDIWQRFYPFPEGELQKYMEIARKNWLLCFGAKKNSELIAIHLVEKYGTYLRCHAAWFDREMHQDRQLSTYMWFSLISHNLGDPDTKWLDLGGGPLHRLREDHYKRRYNPEMATSFFVKMCLSCSFHYLVDQRLLHGGKMVCPNCGNEEQLNLRRRLILSLLRWF
jgi:predicted RNA-binding Zn-ribbon protein involved in translation (DUF1610 family)